MIGEGCDARRASTRDSDRSDGLIIGHDGSSVVVFLRLAFPVDKSMSASSEKWTFVPELLIFGCFFFKCITSNLFILYAAKEHIENTKEVNQFPIG